jgi:hypothetical protein
MDFIKENRIIFIQLQYCLAIERTSLEDEGTLYYVKNLMFFFKLTRFQH